MPVGNAVSRCSSLPGRQEITEKVDRAGSGIDVVIPVYKPEKELRQLLKMLEQQTVRPEHILLINTQREFFDESCTAGMDGIQVVHIAKSEFDHGGTRHRAAAMLHGAFLLFLTQDAVPADEYLVERLYQAFEEKQVCAAYARQLPKQDCNTLEKYARAFNYGEKSRVKTLDDLEELGVKTFFCSNVCAMYRRSAYEEFGGFERHTVFNEDMIFAAKLILHGRAVAYCAQARVLHSHNYSGRQQFHRNFDLGVSQAEHPEVFAAVPPEREGVRMVKQTAAWLVRTGKPFLLPKLVWQSGCKYLGYLLGKNYRRLPRRVVIACSMNRDYWR